MLGTEQMARLVGEVRRASAKLVLVGGTRQRWPRVRATKPHRRSSVFDLEIDTDARMGRGGCADVAGTDDSATVEARRGLGVVIGARCACCR